MTNTHMYLNTTTSNFEFTLIKLDGTNCVFTQLLRRMKIGRPTRGQWQDLH